MDAVGAGWGPRVRRLRGNMSGRIEKGGVERRCRWGVGGVDGVRPTIRTSTYRPRGRRGGGWGLRGRRGRSRPLYDDPKADMRE